jgi:hypothetical protein
MMPLFFITDTQTFVTVHTPYEKRQCFNNIAELDMFAFQSIKISDQRSHTILAKESHFKIHKFVV